MGKHTQCKLYVNGRFLLQKQTGVQRFAREVVTSLDVLLGEPRYADLANRAVLLVPPKAPTFPNLNNIRQVSGGSLGHGYGWEQIDLVRLSADGVLLNLCNLAPLAKRRQVVVVHDASPWAVPQAFSRTFRTVYNVLVPAIARRAGQLATVSEFSRSEISRWIGVPTTRFSVCHEGGEHILARAADVSILARHGLRSGGYFLAVGMGPFNKNQKLLLDAFFYANLGETSMVLTGQRNPRVHGGNALEIPTSVVHVGHVSDSELRALYEGALALVFPSSYEGFGLPPLEAMVCGCPVIVSDQPALLEVVGNAALITPVGDLPKLNTALRRIFEDTDLRKHLSQLGLERAKRFTWRTTTERLVSQCQMVAA